MTISIRSIAICSIVCLVAFQQSIAQYTSAEARSKGYEQRLALQKKSLTSEVPFKNIGPTVFSGRVVDIDVNPTDPTIYYVAYASGGLWKTENNGSSFHPIFDHEMVMTIGDIAVDWENGTIWVGSGESNSSRSSYAGNGIYKSNDEGSTWENLGPTESHHIGRVVLDESDPEVAIVAACGHLYTSNPERGIYLTEDGGLTWQHVLSVDDKTGAIDIVRDPIDPAVLYAAMWERDRKAWNFQESGKGSGIYKSTDGGRTWTLMSTTDSGFPTGDGVGRIGLSVSEYGGKTYLYALVDNYDRRPPDEDDEEKELTKDDLRNMSATEFKDVDEDDLRDFLNRYRFPKKYGVKEVRAMVAKEEILPNALVEYVEDANSLLFDTPVIGAEVYRSEDGGETWSRTHEGYLDYLYNSYGYYFGRIGVHPTDPNKIFVLGVPLLRSNDAGKTWLRVGGANVHSDHQAIWINPNRPGHIINGNDGGLNTSYDDGETWTKQNAPSVGQFYAIAFDKAKPYNVYGGTQDNGTWKGPSNYSASTRWHGTGHYPYEPILGGDGMQVQVDWRDNETVYAGSQYGNYYRLNKNKGIRKRISPKHELGERPLRFNWESPIHLSRHNQDILYFGSNKLHRSMNQGDDWDALSDDLTQGGKEGDVAFGTLTTIDESPLRFGLIYVGSDDGLVHVSKDAGASWQGCNDGLPSDLWVGQLVASEHSEARVYLVLNGYRNDDFEAYLYRSDDYGATWSPLGDDLPLEPLNTVCEDPVNENLLYVGSDHGVYASLDAGASFQTFDGDLPRVAVHDLLVQPETNDLIVGTHGRSIYIADISPLQAMEEDLLASDLHIYPIGDVKYSSRWGQKLRYQEDPFMTPEVDVIVFAQKDAELSWMLRTEDDVLLNEGEFALQRGLNYLSFEPEVTVDALEYISQAKEKDEDLVWKEPDNTKTYLLPGNYRLSIGAENVSIKVTK